MKSIGVTSRLGCGFGDFVLGRPKPVATDHICIMNYEWGARRVDRKLFSHNIEPDASGAGDVFIICSFFSGWKLSTFVRTTWAECCLPARKFVYDLIRAPGVVDSHTSDVSLATIELWLGSLICRGSRLGDTESWRCELRPLRPFFQLRR